MSDFQVAADTFPIWKAVLWIFYPMAALVMVELLLRGFDDDCLLYTSDAADE